jgi:hypothetical protein
VSDSFNNLESEAKKFDAYEYLWSLCSGKKIKTAEMSEIHFSSGWKIIVKELIDTISNYSISLTYMSDAHSQLDVSFNVLDKTREVFVWRAIEKARRHSREICAGCGNQKHPWRNKVSVDIFCETCAKNQAKQNSTGTWLDKY